MVEISQCIPLPAQTLDMFATAALAALAFGATQAAANGGVLSYSINGQTYEGYVCSNPQPIVVERIAFATVSRRTTRRPARPAFNASGTPTTR